MKELPHGSLLPESFIRKSIRFGAKTATPLSLLTASLIFTACGGEKASGSTQLPSTSKTSESSALPNPENPFAVLSMPFPKDLKMSIQQAWKSPFDPNHHGIDFIKGELDNSRTWKSFPVTATADGKACVNPRSRIGNAVLLTHSIGDTPIGSSYYGHLENAEKDIPECKTGQTVSKRKGDKIGNAGADGAQDKSWIHLHFQVNDANGNSIDPYDLRDERELYPDPNFKNGKPCGPKALFIDCSSKGAVVAGPKDPIPPISGQVNEKKAEGKNATATPKSAETKKEEWKTFKSDILPYEIKIPASWPGRDSYGPDGEGWIEKERQRLDVFSYLLDDRDFDVTLESIKKSYEQDQELTNIKITKRKVAGFNAQTIVSTQTIQIESNLETFEEHTTSLMVPEADGSRRLWKIQYRYDPAKVARPEAERIYSQFLDSFKILPSASSVENKTNVEKKVSVSKKSDELYRALLTSPIAPNVLPQGMSARGTSAGEIDATGKALKQIGAVNILIEDSVLTDVWKTPGSGKVFYGIFPDSSGAKNASELIGTHLGNGQALKDFPYPTKIYTTENSIGGVTFMATKVLITSVENITVATSLTGLNSRGIDANLVQSRAISLARAAIEHLGKVGK